MKRCCIKCYRCNARFYGNSFDEIRKDNDLKRHNMDHYCNCAIVDQFAAKISKPKKKTIFSNGDIQE